jgi:hypothetical protein
MDQNQTDLCGLGSQRIRLNVGWLCLSKLWRDELIDLTNEIGSAVRATDNRA